MSEADETPVRIPITDELDLHTFRPEDLAVLIPEYLALCRERGYSRVRIVHGKGTGALRQSVQALLRRSPLVSRIEQGDETSGGWGATVAWLRPTER